MEHGLEGLLEKCQILAHGQIFLPVMNTDVLLSLPDKPVPLHVHAVILADVLGVVVVGFTAADEAIFVLVVNVSEALAFWLRKAVLVHLADGTFIDFTPGLADVFVPELVQIGCRFIDTPIDRRGMNPLHDGKLFRQYRAILREIKPDLVLTYTIKPNIYGGLACRMAHIPYAVNITGLGSTIENGGWLKKFVLALYRPALKGARVVFFENAGNRDTLAATGVVPKGRDVVLHGAGVNLEDYPCQPYPQEGPVRFLFVGRVMHEKGVDELFAAAKRMKQQYGEQVEFHMVGSFEEAYKPVMDPLEQAGVVRYHGYQSDMKPFYAMADCVVLPSYHEGMSNVLLEAAASGRPLITSDIPGCREAVENGVSGYLCPARDAGALYETMRRFAALPVEQRSQMGRCGRERMEQQFSKTAVVAETIKHLEI